MKKITNRQPLPVLLLLLLAISLGMPSAVKAMRIVSLDLCTDWMLLHYAKSEQEVSYSPLLVQYPSPWKSETLPRHDGSLEQILALDPELVIGGEYNAIILRQRLQQLGLHVEVLSLPQSLQAVPAYLRRFLSLLNRDTVLPRVEPSRVQPAKGRLLLLGANAIGTGRNTLEHDIIEAAGWRNYLQRPGFLSLDLEQLVADSPDAILWAAPVSPSLANLFAQHPALKRAGRRLSISAEDQWRWHCPGPWTYELIETL